MSVGNSQGSMEILFDFVSSPAGVDTNSALIFEKITGELEAYLARESNDKDSTDCIFDHLLPISDSVQERVN